MSAAAEIAQKYVKAHGADRKKDGGSRGGSGVSDSRTTVGVGSSGSDRNMFCVYCKKVGTGSRIAVNGRQMESRR